MKFNKLNKQLNNISNKIEKIKKFSVSYNNPTFFKNIGEIKLLENFVFNFNDYQFQHYTLIYEYELPKDIELQHLKFIYPKFYITSDNGTNFDTVKLYQDFNILFKYNKTNYILKITWFPRLFDSSTTPYEYKTIYLNLSLVITNRRVWSAISKTIQ